MLTLALYATILLVGLVIGAYSHKWLAKVTGAPANIVPTAAGAKVAVQDVAKKV